MTDFESELRSETAAVNGGRDLLLGYRLVSFDAEGRSSWYHPGKRHHLWRDPNGAIVDPRTLRPVDLVGDLSIYQQKERVPHE